MFSQTIFKQLKLFFSTHGGDTVKSAYYCHCLQEHLDLDKLFRNKIKMSIYFLTVGIVFPCPLCRKRSELESVINSNKLTSILIMPFEIPLEAINWEVENQLKPTIFRISFRPFLKYSTVDFR